ncbi:MAG: DMT family transporter, partial [Clostridiales bacterium]|nr:DMT family transporter [Clostridiales bacterium]
MGIKKEEVASILYLFLTAMIWGFAFVAQVVGMDFVGTFTFNGVRFAVGSISLVPVILLFEKSSAGADVKQMLFGGICGGAVLFAASSLQQFGIELTGS